MHSLAESSGLIDNLGWQGLHMPNEPLALAIKPPPDAADQDYQAIYAALSASARGRAFLAEYVRRNRAADTELLLRAIEWLEALMRAHAPAGDPLRPQPAAPAPPEPPEPSDAAHSFLAVVQPLDEPELPIPSPSTAQPPAIALVHERTTAAIMPEVTFVASPPPLPVRAETELALHAVVAAAIATAGPVPATDVAPKVEVTPPPADPLALLMALTEEERIALFT
jgi:hypothetical protein